MTIQEFHAKVLTSERRLEVAAQAVVTCARGLVPTLRDRGCEHAAMELERLLFVHDQEVEEIKKFMQSEIENVLKAINPLTGGRP